MNLWASGQGEMDSDNPPQREFSPSRSVIPAVLQPMELEHREESAWYMGCPAGTGCKWIIYIYITPI